MQSGLTTSKSIGYGLLVTLIFFFVLEGLARLIEVVVPPPGFVEYQKVPEQKGESYRIFVFGGSTVYGEPLPAYGFVAQLEHWLRARHPDRPLEVFNFGRPSQPSAYVRDRVKEAVELDPDLLIVLTGHNEFLNRHTERSLSRIVDRFAVIRVLAREWKRFRVTYLPLPREIVTPVAMEGFDRNSELFAGKVSDYERNLRTAARAAVDRNIPVLFLTVPSNLADWPPVYLHFESMARKQEYFSIYQLLESGKLGQAEARLAAHLQQKPDDSLFLYLRGLWLVKKGDAAAAHAEFMRAKDNDILPWRAPSRMNAVIRSLSELDGVVVADVEKAFQEQSTRGQVGFDFFADNCHPSPLGNALIADEILRAMSANGWFLPAADAVAPGENKILVKRDQFLGSIPAEHKRPFQMVYLLNNAKYAMKSPFYNFRASRMYLEAASRVDPENWVVWANLASLAMLEKRPAEGDRLFKKAVSLRQKAINPNDRQATPYLKEALEERNKAGAN